MTFFIKNPHQESATPHLVNAGKYFVGMAQSAFYLLDSAYRRMVFMDSEGYCSKDCVVYIYSYLSLFRLWAVTQAITPREWTYYQIIWIIVSLVQTVYSLLYDIIMDWGLGLTGSDYRLRNCIIYPRFGMFFLGSFAEKLMYIQASHGMIDILVYYMACVIDIILRSTWLLRLVHYPLWLGGTQY